MKLLKYNDSPLSGTEGVLLALAPMLSINDSEILGEAVSYGEQAELTSFGFKTGARSTLRRLMSADGATNKRIP